MTALQFANPVFVALDTPDLPRALASGESRSCLMLAD